MGITLYNNGNSGLNTHLKPKVSRDMPPNISKPSVLQQIAVQRWGRRCSSNPAGWGTCDGYHQQPGFCIYVLMFSLMYDHGLLWANDMFSFFGRQMRTYIDMFHPNCFFQLSPQRFQQMFTPSWTHLKVVICNMTPGAMRPSVAFRKKTFHSCILQRNIFFENITCHSQTSQSSFSSFGMLNQSTDHSIVSMGTGPPLEVLPKTN